MPDVVDTDLVIIGGGPAGLSAAANAAAEGIKVRLLEARSRLGGQAGTSSRIENYLGFPDGVSGGDLTERAAAQAQRLGASLETDRRVVEVSRDGSAWIVTCAGGHQYRARAVLLASGADWRKLDVPGASTCRALFYGAMPEDLARFQGEHIAIIGAANSAGQAALHAADAGARVTILARRTLADAMSAYLVRRIERHPRIQVAESVTVSALAEVRGGTVLALDGEGAAEFRGGLYVAAAFVYIGADPSSDFVPADCGTDGRGFVLVSAPGSYAAEGAPGLFVVGDIRAGSRKRVATAAGEGATATAEIWTYLGTFDRVKNGP